MYNDIILDHFMNPRHIGKLSDANGVGTIGDPGCGDYMCVYIKVENDLIKDISFLCKGCPAAIACGSAVCELAFGTKLKDAVYITDETVSQYLGGLPGEKVHCSNLAAGALRYAIADYLGIRIDPNDNRMPIIERVRAVVKSLALESGLLKKPIEVEIKRLPPESVLGKTAQKDYPIWKGKEGLLEARFLNGIGQAYSPALADFSGLFEDILSMELDGTYETTIMRRGVFVSAVNAFCSHLGIAEKTIHCKNDGPVECAKDLLGVISAGYEDGSRIALIGCQPRMIEALSSVHELRVIDLDPDNIGRNINGITIEGEENTEEALDWCDLALVTGNTLVNGSIDRFLGLRCHTVFYGVTIAGAAALLRLPRFCTRGM